MTSLRCHAALIALVGSLGITPIATGQTVWNMLLSEFELLPGADVLPGFQPNELVRNNGFRDLTLAPNGNFAGLVSTDRIAPFGSEDWYLYGSVDRGATVGALRREGDYDGQTQTVLRSAVGIDNAGNLLYEARLASAGTPDSLWLNDELLFLESDAIPAGPLTGSFIESISNTNLSPDGVAYWTGSYASTPGGSTDGVAIFRDTSSFDVLLQSGTSIGAGLIAEPELFAGNLSWSANRTNYVAKIKVAPTPSSNHPNFDIDEAVVLNGQVLTVEGGGVLREGNPIPAAAGGLPDETWAPGSLSVANEAGDWAISSSARLNGTGNTVSDFLVVNGKIRFREGDTVDGFELPADASPADLSFNDRGDFAFVWGNHGIINDKVVIRPGDSVDTDGDGVGDQEILNVFDLSLTNLPSAEGDGSLLVYIKARLVNGREVVLRNDLVTLTGDYNGDGVVNAADYTVWRDSDGSELLLAADGNGDNVIDADDLTVWSNNFGATLPAASSAIPEAATGTLLLLGVFGFAVRRQAKRS